MSKNVVRKIDDRVKLRHILVSVSDKSGLEDFIPGLVSACPGVTIYSTGGTYARLGEILGAKANKRLVQVSDYTGQPEMQGGLVKTLDFKIYLGLLSETYNKAHKADLKRTDAVAIDMVVVNLYPFADTIAKRGISAEDARANIDIGGPCMIRAAAKNFIRVASLVEPGSYKNVLKELGQNKGSLSLKTRYKLAGLAFEHTAGYDRAIADYLSKTAYAKMAKAYPELIKK